ncbi:MAG: hypothetical protein FWF08_09170, partial [Oscillospiraceae bacterium]|nr:hypothetical protein [Oscillospiraceae bacterium]
FNYIVTDFMSDQSFAKYIDALVERRLYDTGVDIRSTDKLITLSTCVYDFDEARLVIVGRLAREGENIDVDTSVVKTNINPRYPQAWYTKNRLTNPYRNSYRWTPTSE